MIGKVMVQYDVRSVAKAVEVLASPSPVSLQDVVEAMACVLRDPSNIDLLIDSRPPSMVDSTLTGLGNRARRTQQEKVLNDVKKLVDLFLKTDISAAGELNAETILKHLAPVARAILEYVSCSSGPGVDVMALSSEWLESFLSQMQGGGTAAPNYVSKKEMLRHFFMAAHIRLQDLKPVDGEGSCPDGDIKDAQMLFVENNVGKVPGPAVLGRGSYAVIWRAKDQHTGQLCAVKTFRKDGLMRIPKWECKVSSQLTKHKHPFIVRIHQVFQNMTMGSFSIVMECCPGGDLRYKIYTAWKAAQQAETAYEAPAEALRWLGQVLLGLEHLHLELNMLHLDIKPDNVLINGNGNAMLIDFGFSNLGERADGPFAFGVPPGSPDYVAPEVLLKQSYSYSADLYSFGVLIWVALTGGIVTSARPCNPPCADWRPPKVEPLLSNWQRLEEVMLDPAAHAAPSLHNEDAKDLILKLTNRGEDWSEFRHQSVREHPLFEGLHLPELRASAHQLTEWAEEPSHNS